MSDTQRVVARESAFCGPMVAGLLVGLILLSPPVANAQPYPDVEVDDSLRSKKSAVKSFVKSGGDANARANYENYFADYFFPAMRRSTPETLGKVGELRFSLFKNFLWQGQPAVQQDLTEKAYSHAAGVLGNRGDFHPTVSYNAVLLLGGLDQQYGSDRRGSTSPPRPLPKANTVLSKVVQMAVKGEWPLYLEAGALVGLQRHARFIRALPREAQGNTVQALQLVAKQTEFPDGTSDEVRAWIKRQACQGIANFGTPGRKGEFANALLSVIADKTLPLATRCDIAGMLGGMRLQGGAGVDFAASYTTLQGVAAEVGADAGKTAAEYNEFQLGRNKRTLINLLDPERFFVDENDDIVLERRTLAAKHKQIRDAMTAMAAIAGDQAAEVNRYVSAFDQALKVAGASDQESDDFDLVETLKNLAAEIETLTPAKPAESETAEAGLEAEVDTADKPDAETSRR